MRSSSSKYNYKNRKFETPKSVIDANKRKQNYDEWEPLDSENSEESWDDKNKSSERVNSVNGKIIKGQIPNKRI